MEEHPYLKTVKSVNLYAARSVIQAAQHCAQEQGWAISVAVVDCSGEIVALEKNDDAIGVSASVALAKAKTAALLQAPSKQFEDFVNHGSPSFLSTPGVTELEGGVPLIVDGQFIGAVGVSGAHGENDSFVAVTAANVLTK